MAIRDELIEELLAGRDLQKVFSSDGLLDELKKVSAERILNPEMDQHLAAERAEEAAGDSSEAPQWAQPQDGPDRDWQAGLQVPRDRQASFEPQLITNYRQRFLISTTRSSPSTPGA